MKSFVIETSGKQFDVKYGEIITIDAILGKKGDKIVFDKILMTKEDEIIKVGTPYLEGISVEGEIVKNGRGEKVKIGKYKSKVHYRRKMGFRSRTTDIIIREPGKKKIEEVKPKEKPVVKKKAVIIKKSTTPRKRKTETK